MPERACKRAVLSLGANTGRREENILAALHELDLRAEIAVVRVSALFETEPVGEGFTGDFINAACIIETCLDPHHLLDQCHGIERAFGRRPVECGGDRPLDIDIIVYGNRLIDEPDLVVPHRALRHRLFVLEPVCEIAPDLSIPPDGMTIRDIRTALGGGQIVRRISARRIFK